MPASVVPTPASARSKIACTCGRKFNNKTALHQHKRDSPLHANDPNASGSNSTVTPVPIISTSANAAHIPTVLPKPTPTADARKTEGPTGQQYADFRDENTFPTFAGLPDENDVDLAFYKTEDGFRYTPRKHWCFLAEIVEIELFVRVTLFARDKSNNTVRVAFYTDGRGTEFPESQLQRGYTIAILYALQHGFLDMSTGVRQEEYSGVKIIPTSLDELLRLGDRVRQYSPEHNGKRVCHGCDEVKPNLQKCSHCSLFWYCNKSCQTKGWNDKGHKRDCKIVRDKDLQAMFVMDWNQFQDFVEFPLRNVTTAAGRPPASGGGLSTMSKQQPSGSIVDMSAAERSNNTPFSVQDLIQAMDLDSIDVDSIDETSCTDGIEALKGKESETKAPENKQDRESHQDAKAVEKAWRQIEQEKSAARAEQTLRRLTTRTEPSDTNTDEATDIAHEGQTGAQDAISTDDVLVRRCLRSVIPSVTATTGTDLLELINFDILNEHLGLKFDLSSAWRRLLAPQAKAGNIETLLAECAPDSAAWSILRREFNFKFKLWEVILGFEKYEKMENASRGYLIRILEDFKTRLLDSSVEWEIVSERVPRGVMKMAIAVAKEGSDPPGIDPKDEDFQIDLFFGMVADKSESSLFGTPDSDNPRYWDYWMRRDGLGSDDS